MSDQEYPDFNKRLSYSSHRPSLFIPSTPQHRQYSIGFQQRARLPRVPSERIIVRSPRFDERNLQQTRIPSRKQNQMITNLKSELQNIKSEVAKLIHKDQGVESPYYPSLELQRQKEQLNNFMGENSSVSSIVVSRKIKNRMETEVSDKEQYVLLENQILKSEVKNLKNKYIMKKTEMKEETMVLKKKIVFLEGIIEKREQELLQCKQEIEREISIIKQNMIVQNQQQQYNQGFNNQLHRSPRSNIITEINSSESIHIGEDQQFQRLINQIESLKDQNNYLKKRVIEASQQVKQMAIQNNQLNIQLKRNYTQPQVDPHQIQQIKLQFQAQIQEKNQIIENQAMEFREITDRYNVSYDELANKKAELIHVLNCEKENYERLQGTLQFKIEELVRAQQKIQNLITIQQNYYIVNNKYQQAVIQEQTLFNQTNRLKNDLNELSSSLMSQKMKTQDLSLKIEKLSTEQSAGSEFQLRYQELQKQLQEYKVHVRSMILETAQKINTLEMENQKLKEQINEMYKMEMLNVETFRIENQKLQELLRVEQHKTIKVNVNQDLEENDVNSLRMEEQSIKIQMLQRKIEDLQIEISSLENNLESKDRELDVLKIDNNKLQNLFLNQSKEYDNLKISFQTSLCQFKQKQLYFEQVLSSANIKIAQLETHYVSSFEQHSLDQPNVVVNQNVDQTIKTQSDCILKLRSIISNKNQEIESFRENSTLLSNIVDNLRQELDEQRNRSSIQKQNIRNSHNCQILNYQNSLNVSNGHVSRLEHKLKLILEGNGERVDAKLGMVSYNNTEAVVQIGQLSIACQKKINQMVSQTQIIVKQQEVTEDQNVDTSLSNLTLNQQQPQLSFHNYSNQTNQSSLSETLLQNTQS